MADDLLDPQELTDLAVELHAANSPRATAEQVIKYLIMGNVKRGQMYPLCVGAERVMQAQTIAEYARKLGTKVVAHGCTAAGNDQVRFEVALRTLAPVVARPEDAVRRRRDQVAAQLPPQASPVSPNHRGQGRSG